MARTGLRDIEVSRALVGDIRQETARQSSGSRVKVEIVKMTLYSCTKEALKPLKRYLKTRGKLQRRLFSFSSNSDRNNGGPLTTRSISRIVKTALIKAGMDDSRLTAHSLRHTAIYSIYHRWGLSPAGSGYGQTLRS